MRFHYSRARTHPIFHVIGGGFLILCDSFFGIVLPLLFPPGSHHLERLAPVSFTDLQASPPGRTVLFEGVLSPSNPTTPEGFVASYRMYTREDSSGRTRVSTEHYINPILRVDMSGGVVRVRRGYRLIGQLVEVKGPRRRANADPDWILYGLPAESPVFLVGSVVNGGNEVAFAAEQVWMGTREQAIHSHYMALRIFTIFGYIVMGLGVALIVRRLRG